MIVIIVLAIALENSKYKTLPLGDSGPLSIPGSWEVFHDGSGGILCKVTDTDGSETNVMVELIYLFEDGKDRFVDISNNKKYTIEYLESISLNNLVTLHRVSIGTSNQSDERYMLEIFTKENGVVNIRNFLFDSSVDIETIKRIGRLY